MNLFTLSDDNNQQRLRDAGYEPAHDYGSDWWVAPDGELVREAEALRRLRKDGV